MQKYTTGEKEKTEIENSDFLQNLTHQLSDAQKLGKTSPYKKQCSMIRTDLWEGVLKSYISDLMKWCYPKINQSESKCYSNVTKL